jgi:hypothetical protein
MSTHKAKCNKCSYRASFSNPLLSYDMSDHSKVNIQRTFVWCGDCREVRWGEELPDLIQLESELAATPANESFLREKLQFKIAWRRTRRSAPRCLECGSTDVTSLTRSQTHRGNGKWTLREHPDCGGVVTVLVEPVLALDRRWILYSPEGEKKQAYKMSPHRGAVPIDG